MRSSLLKRCAAIALTAATFAGLPASASPVSVHGAGNVTRLAQARWTEKKDGVRVRWMLDARHYTDGVASRSPDVSSGAQVILARNVCTPEGCRGTARWWPLDDDSFTFDPLLKEVRVVVPGKIRLVWRATGGEQVVTDRRVGPGVYTDPEDYVGVDAEATAVGALGRPAEVSGRIRGYPGRVKSDADIYMWVGTFGFAGACVADQGSPCL